MLGVVVNGSLSTGRPVTRGVLQGPTLFSMFADDMDNRIDGSLCKFAGDTRLCEAVNTLEGRDTIQRDFDRLDRWADTNLMEFNQVKHKAPHLERGNVRHTYGLGGEMFESSPVERDLAVMVAE